MPGGGEAAGVFDQGGPAIAAAVTQRGVFGRLDTVGVEPLQQPGVGRIDTVVDLVPASIRSVLWSLPTSGVSIQVAVCCHGNGRPSEASAASVTLGGRRVMVRRMPGTGTWNVAEALV